MICTMAVKVFLILITMSVAMFYSPTAQGQSSVGQSPASSGLKESTMQESSAQNTPVLTFITINALPFAHAFKKRYPDYSVVTYCQGSFTGKEPEYVVAAARVGSKEGLYIVFLSDTVIELSEFTGRPELNCMNVSQAQELDAVIKSSEGITGGIKVGKFSHDILYAFVEETRAVCWAFDATMKKFVIIGGWIT